MIEIVVIIFSFLVVLSSFFENIMGRFKKIDSFIGISINKQIWNKFETKNRNLLKYLIIKEYFGKTILKIKIAKTWYLEEVDDSITLINIEYKFCFFPNVSNKYLIDITYKMFILNNSFDAVAEPLDWNILTK